MSIKINDSVSIYEPISRRTAQYAWRSYFVSRLMGDECTLTSADLKRVRSPVSVGLVEELIKLQNLERDTNP